MNQILQLLPQRKEVCFVVKQAFSKSFCEQLILQKKHSFQSAQSHYPTSYRNNERQILDNQILAEKLFLKIKNYVPLQIEIEGIAKEEKGSWNLRQLNDRIRICRYLPGQYFNKHLDGVHFRSKELQSKLTFMVYLNSASEYQGGRTLFFDSKEDDSVIQSFLPEEGDLIIFDHNLWHSGEEVLSGEKYILRSDILYQKNESETDKNNGAFSEGHLGYIWSIIRFNNNILTAGRDRLIKVWNTSTEQKVDEFLSHENSIFALLKLNDQTLLSASRDQLIKFWKKENGKFLLQKDIEIHKATVLTLCKIDDSIFVSGGGDGIINIVNEYGNVLLQWKGHEEWIWQIVKISETKICSVGEGGMLKIWNYTNGELLDSFLINFPINTIAFDSDRKIIFIGNAKGEILSLFWKRDQCELILQNTFQAHQGIIRRLKIVNGFLFSAGEDSKVRIWNYDEKKCIQEIKHDNFVQDFIIENDYLISVSYDGRILKTKLIESFISIEDPFL
ncbi:MAG: 2OG-Fe(II) oxygenase [Saprospiraceae bacterium]